MRTLRLGRGRGRRRGRLVEAPRIAADCTVRVIDALTGAVVAEGSAPNTITAVGLNAIGNAAISQNRADGFINMALQSAASGGGTQLQQSDPGVVGTGPTTGASPAHASFTGTFPTTTSAIPAVASIRFFGIQGTLGHVAMSALTRTDGVSGAFPTRKEANHIWAITWTWAFSVSGDVGSSRASPAQSRAWAGWMVSTDSMQTGTRAWTIYSIQQGAFRSQDFAFALTGTVVSGPGPGDSSTPVTVTVRTNFRCNVAGTYTAFELRRGGATMFAARGNQTFTAGQVGSIDVTFTITTR